MTTEQERLKIQLDIAFEDTLKTQMYLIRTMSAQERQNFARTIDLLRQQWKLKDKL